MDTFLELQQAVRSDLSVSENSPLFPPATIQLAINRSYVKCAGLFRWAETEDAKKTVTQANIDYYNYPDTFKPDSIWKMMVNGIDYGKPLSFSSYQFEIENDRPRGLDYMWTSQHRRFFLYPTPTVADLEIVVWGFSSPDKLELDADVTIWSYSMPECNEAVVLEAVGILKGKGEDDKGGQFRSMEAKQILSIAWNKVKQDQDKYQQAEPFFVVPDMFAQKGKPGNVDMRGRF